MDADAIFAALWQTNITRCEKPGSEAAIRKIAESMMGYEPALALANGHAPDDEGSPAIPQRVYDLLPDAIQEGCSYFDGWHDTPVYDRQRLHSGNQLSGPPIIEQMDSTTVVHPGQTAHIDRFGNIIIELA